jgi:hypothetical protein
MSADGKINYGDTYMSEDIKIKSNCRQCKKEFDTNDPREFYCSKQCKEEALAELDNGSDECLSCQ